MPKLTASEFGTDVQKFTLVSDENAYMPEFAEFNNRIPTNLLKRFYMNIFIPQATTTVGSYTVGILPIKAYLVAVKHVVKAVASAATVEVEVGSNGSCMTAQSASTSVQTAALATAAADRLGNAGDIIVCKIATASGDLTHLCLMLAFEPYL